MKLSAFLEQAGKLELEKDFDLYLIATGDHGERGTAKVDHLEFMEDRVLIVTKETFEVKRPPAVEKPSPSANK